MRVNLVLCTYNGSRFIGRQLQSFSDQTRRPDRVFINDDASADDTVARIESWARQCGIAVDLEVNRANLGFTRNFAACLSRVRPRDEDSIVMLSDQDDAWMPRKIEAAVDALTREAGAGLAFCDSELADAELRGTGERFLRGIGFDAIVQQTFERNAIVPLLRRNFVQGACTAFRASYVDEILPIPQGWWHDHWIASVVACHARLAFVDEPLLLYRQHVTQALGGRPKSLMRRVIDAARVQSTVDHHRGTLDQVRALRQRVTAARHAAQPAALAAIDDRILFGEARVAMRNSRWKRPFHAIRQWRSGRYTRYAQGAKSLVYDLVF